VIVRAVRLLAGVAMKAGLDLEVFGVKLLLLPPVTVGAFVLVLAPIFVRSNKFLRVPVLTHLLGVTEYGGLPSVILPIVGVHAHITLVVVFSVGTPHSFEVENVEVHIGLKFLNQLDGQLSLIVSERTEFAILAFTLAVQIDAAEFSLILIGVVKLFHSVMRLLAAVLERTVLVVVNVPTFFGLVGSQRSPPILFEIVIVGTHLNVVT
jgi:hypothetical protein